MENRKILGIVGGMGQNATLDFYKTFLEYQNVDHDSKCIRTIIDMNSWIPSRYEYFEKGGENPKSEIFNSITLLSDKVDLIAIPCNTAHYWFDELYYEYNKFIFSNFKWLNMIEIVSNNLISCGHKKPLILSAYTPWKHRDKFYSKYFQQAVYPSKDDLELIIKHIIRRKRGCVSPYISKHPVYSVVEKYQNQCDSIILACTELSEGYAFDLPDYDSSEIYAKECVDILKG